ncbi:hypothetical protein [Micromonospora sp. RTGN7]|uniref:O-antigen ligase family protein n=1 Tax=Micromonospora sp. RTGN7 TaxID=3016526 RepID=UPI0029FF0DF9|nr:hypothetical protein [Micromonospora sp. RTGN7]
MRAPDRTTDFRLPMAVAVVVVLAIVGSMVFTGGDASLQLAAMIYLGLLLISAYRPMVAVVAVLVALLLAVTSFAKSMGAVDPRFLLLPFVAVLALHPGRRPATAPADRSTSARALRYTLPAVAVFALASTLWSADPRRTLSTSAALLVMAVFCHSAARVVGVPPLLRAVAVLTWIVVAASVLYFLLAPSSATKGNRLYGIFDHPNSLAAFVVVAAPIVLSRLTVMRWPAAAVLGALCVFSASRAGSAAFALELMVFAMAGRARNTRILGTLAAAGVGAWYIREAVQSWTAPALPLLRTNNSREATWADGLQHFREHPLLGVGAGALPPGTIGGLWPYLLATTGLVGTALAAGFVIVLATTVVRASPLYRALVVGTLVDNIFEPWLFTGGLVFCVLFWLLVHLPQTHSVRPGRVPLAATDPPAGEGRTGPLAHEAPPGPLGSAGRPPVTTRG